MKVRSILTAVTSVALSLALFTQSVLAASWTTPINISNPGIPSVVPSIATGNNGYIHVTWTAFLQDPNGMMLDREIYYARSTDNGSSFSTPINISNSPDNPSGEPVIAVARDQSNEVHIVWEELAQSGGSEVFYTNSMDDGTTWPLANHRNVSASLEGPTGGSPHLFIDSTTTHNVHIVWTDYVNGLYGQIYYSKSADGGNSFSPGLNVSNTGRDSDQPAIIADSGATHIAWHDNENLQIYYSRTTDGGVSFSPPEQRSNAVQPAIEPVINIDGQNRVHIIWTQFNDVGGSDIFWTASSDNGVTFTTAQNRTNSPLTTSQTPAMTSRSGGRLVIVWSDSNSDGTLQIWSMNSSNGGSSWQPAESVTLPGQGVLEPSITAKGNSLYLVWQENDADIPTVKFARGS